MFTPALPMSGYAGWKFLERTRETQQAVLTAQPVYKNNVDYFRENIGKITTAEELVADRRLRAVALGAFGLDDDINAKFFIQKVLEGSTLEPGTLPNKLADKRYFEMSKAFGFGDFPTSPNTQLSTFADSIIAKYEDRQFELAVGEQDQSLRLALNAQRELPALAGKKNSVDTKWFTIMGSGPLREVFETALGLPKSFGSADLDQQLGVFKERAEQYLGSDDPAMFSDPEKVDDLIRLYTIRAEVAAGISSSAPGATALTLLQNSGIGFF